MSAVLETSLSGLGSAAREAEADRAILRTVTYAGLFQFPLTLRQLHRALMDVPLDMATLTRRLDGPFLRERVRVTHGFAHPRGREKWLPLRRERERRARGLLERHGPFLRRLVRFPFVRLVALSGGCAHGNARDADVDVFLVVERGRAWSVCLALMLLSKWAGLRRSLCLNYIVDASAVALPEHDLFTASEIVGMKPLAGCEAYRRFVHANAWVCGLFPNFFATYRRESEQVPEAGAPRWVEALLGRGPAPVLEALSRWLLGSYLRSRTRGHPGVVLSPHRLKLHTHDHRPVLSAAFAAALREAGE